MSSVTSSRPSRPGRAMATDFAVFLHRFLTAHLAGLRGCSPHTVASYRDTFKLLIVFFRDATNGKGTYPAGRFVPLLPEGNGRYRLDFNRARNPFCAYSSVYPCPAPWPGNLIPAPIEAGERYHAAGGTAP